MINYFNEFKAISFPKTRLFPIKLKEIDIIEDKLQASGNKQNPNLINNKIVDLIRIMHGSFESKQKIVEDFNQKNPECSKKSIERKMRDLFEKDKKGSDPR